MKAILIAIIICLVPTLAHAQISQPVVSFTASVTTSEGTRQWGFKDFVCCVNGAGGVTFDCDNTLSATAGLVRNGQCMRFQGSGGCGTLHYIGSGASTIDCFAWK